MIKERQDDLIRVRESLPRQDSHASFKVNVTPRVLQEENIDLTLNVEISTNIGADPPTTQTNTVTTELVVKSKESAAIGGVVVNKSTTDFDKLPPDEVEGSSPLFNFIRSKNFSNSKTQFVVFVTPELIESASQGSEEIKRKFRRRRR